MTDQEHADTIAAAKRVCDAAAKRAAEQVAGAIEMFQLAVEAARTAGLRVEFHPPHYWGWPRQGTIGSDSGGELFVVRELKT